MKRKKNHVFSGGSSIFFSRVNSVGVRNLLRGELKNKIIDFFFLYIQIS